MVVKLIGGRGERDTRSYEKQLGGFSRGIHEKYSTRALREGLRRGTSRGIQSQQSNSTKKEPTPEEISECDGRSFNVQKIRFPQLTTCVQTIRCYQHIGGSSSKPFASCLSFATAVPSSSSLEALYRGSRRRNRSGIFPA